MAADPGVAELSKYGMPHAFPLAEDPERLSREWIVDEDFFNLEVPCIAVNLLAGLEGDHQVFVADPVQCYGSLRLQRQGLDEVPGDAVDEQLALTRRLSDIGVPFA